MAIPPRNLDPQDLPAAPAPPPTVPTAPAVPAAPALPAGTGFLFGNGGNDLGLTPQPRLTRQQQIARMGQMIAARRQRLAQAAIAAAPAGPYAPPIGRPAVPSLPEEGDFTYLQGLYDEHRRRLMASAASLGTAGGAAASSGATGAPAAAQASPVPAFRLL